jgi:myo-inositol 2-dehydrogenase/D-chiro-inositol 1-dehydrogenase/scyllo-inositol 2-dehydrogenase (NAD+)
VKRVKLCVIGAGRAGLIHARNIAERIRSAELVALCDANADSVRQAAEELDVRTVYTDYREAVQNGEVDAVVIVTPTFLHRDIACLAASRGKHVFLEKPMALTVRECEEINAAVDKAAVKLQIGFMRRFDEGFAQAKDLLASGRMGRVLMIKSTGRGPGGPGPWMYDLRKSNGVIAEVNSHDIDSVRWLVGKELRRVYAEAANFKCPDAKERYPDFYDNVVVNLRFTDDTLGVVDGTCPAGYAYDARVEVLCENGLLMIGTAIQQGLTHFTLDGQAIGRSVKSWRTLFKDAYLAEMEHFVRCVLEDKRPQVTGMDGLKAVETVVAINQSIKSGMPVTLGRGDV